MSLIVNDRATPKQLEMLRNLEYYGDMNLSGTQAAELIDEYLEEKRLFYKEMDATEVDIY